MTLQRSIISTALMATALAVAALPMIASAYNSAQAAGISKERHSKQARFKQKRRANVNRRKRGRVVNSRRVVHKKVRKLNKRRPIVRRGRPAVTMPKSVVKAKRRPIARPAVTMPKTVIKTPRRPIARPAVTMPKTVIKPRPRPIARPAVTMPKTVISPRPRPYNRPARPAVTTPKTVVGQQTDPTSGRINNRERAAKQAQYQQCAAFSIRVMQGCYSQAQGDPQKQKSCQRHYQGNVVRCQGLL